MGSLRLTGEASRRRLRRIVAVGFVMVQVAFVVRAYWAPHREFGYQMFPEASQWQAEIVRVRSDGTAVPIDQPWAGYEWNDLVRIAACRHRRRRHHADAGIDNQLAFLDEALDWVASNTPADLDTRYLQATVTTWFNLGPPSTVVLRSHDRELP